MRIKRSNREIKTVQWRMNTRKTERQWEKEEERDAEDWRNKKAFRLCKWVEFGIVVWVQLDAGQIYNPF